MASPSRQRSARLAIAPQLHAERRVADCAGDHDAVAGLGGRAPHHPAMRHRAERGDRNRQRAGRVVGVAAEQRTAVARRILAEPGGEGGEPGLVGSRRQRERQQKTDRLCALGGEIGEVHAQRLAGDASRRIVGKKMHAGDDAVGRQHQIASGRRRQPAASSARPQRARIRGQRAEIARDQAFLGQFICVRIARATSGALLC